MSNNSAEAPTQEELAAAKEISQLVTDDGPTETPSTKPTEEQPKAANPWEDPEAARAEIEKLRKENAAARVNAKTKAADEARAELAQTIGKALGLVKDEPVDPADLTKQLTQAQSEQRQAALELAIFKSTPDAAVANALLDSRSFLEKVADLNPSDSDAIAAAVGEAVQGNPALGKRLPAPNPAQGSSASGPTKPGQLAESDLDRMSPEEIVKAKAEGRLNDLLGIGR